MWLAGRRNSVAVFAGAVNDREKLRTILGKWDEDREEIDVGVRASGWRDYRDQVLAAARSIGLDGESVLMRFYFGAAAVEQTAIRETIDATRGPVEGSDGLWFVGNFVRG